MFFNLRLYTFTSSTTHDFGSRSYLHGTLITITFVWLRFETKFFIWCSPLFVSFLPTLCVPPHTTTTSFFVSFLVILGDVLTIISVLAPGFTIPWTSKLRPRLCCTSWAQPLVWLSRRIMILFCFFTLLYLLTLCDNSKRLWNKLEQSFLVFTVLCCLLNCLSPFEFLPYVVCMVCSSKSQKKTNLL